MKRDQFNELLGIVAMLTDVKIFENTDPDDDSEESTAYKLVSGKDKVTIHLEETDDPEDFRLVVVSGTLLATCDCLKMVAPNGIPIHDGDVYISLHVGESEQEIGGFKVC